jgi:hypothetical protein
MPIRFSPLPALQRLNELLDYDLERGELRWKVDLNANAKAGQLAGSPARRGYKRIMIDGHSYFVHRIIFKLRTGRDPVEEVDHKVGVGLGDGAANLRSASRSQNNQNASLRHDNKVKLKGVCRNSRNVRNPWRALIWIDGKQRHLGSFPTPEAAHAAYCRVAKEIYGEFAKFT